MFRLRAIGWVGLCILLSGCPNPRKEESRPTSEANPALLEPLLLKEKPDAPQGVRQIWDKADGDEVIVQGQVPPGTTRPFVENHAAFLLMDLEDLKDPKVREELECEEAST